MILLDDRRKERNRTAPLMMGALSVAAIIFGLLGYCYWAMGNGSIFM